MTASLLVVSGAILLVGSVVQGAVGFGMNLVAAPLLAIVDPMLVPVPLVLVSSAFTVLPVLRERGHVDWRGVRWGVLGRLPGTALGVAALALLPARGLSIMIGAVVLISVGLSMLAWHPAPTPPALVTAGVVSGTFGTAAAIGGPPLALVYQHSSGPAVRATLGAYFLAGSVVSVTGLGVGGQIHGTELLAALILFPFALTGFLISGPLRKLVDAGRTRPALLAVAGLSALVLLVRAIG